MNSEILTGIFTILAILFTEVILSIDNAAVLALIVNKRLPEKDRKKALRWGMLGAYLFRGLSLLLVSWLLNNPSVGNTFRVLGGLYLLYLFYGSFKSKEESNEEPGWVENFAKKLGLSIFWQTVVIVEAIDLVFSVDNLVAVVGFSKNLWIIVIGVFIGILAMRFVAGTFSKLLTKYPSLETSAFIVIGLLGLKLIISGVIDYIPSLISIKHFMESHTFDTVFSIIMMVIFFIPMVFKRRKKQLVTELA